jgi:hypothetical protein
MFRRPSFPKSDTAAAQACARETSEYFRAQGAIVDRSRETVTHYAKRWCKWRDKKGLGCVAGDRALLDRHILPVLGDFDVRHVARDDLKRLVGKLDAKVKRGKSDDGKPFSAKTAINAWGVARALFRDAQRAKGVRGRPASHHAARWAMRTSRPPRSACARPRTWPPRSGTCSPSSPTS